MENQPLLSVIVPCFNVEKYMDKCILSIIEQTYSNLEIVLINDGSTDETGVKCDLWQTKDNRIRVIHKKNEGLAYARKTGIESITAEYVTFVDADDWIDADKYTNMMAALLSTNSDIAQCGVCIVWEDGSMKHHDSEYRTGVIEVVGRVAGVLLIVEDQKWHSWMWNKIFKKHLFDGIEFYKGNNYAEDHICHYLFHKANQSVFTSDEYCYYLQRSSSINGATDIRKMIKNHIDFFEAWYDRYIFVKQNSEYHSALQGVKLWVLYQGMSLLHTIIECPQHYSGDISQLFLEKSKQLQSISITQNDKIRLGLRIEFFILKFAGTKCYKLIRILYVSIISIMNRLKITSRQTYTLLSNHDPLFQ